VDEEDDDETDIGALIVVIAKRLGFSFEELNELDVQSLIDVAELSCKNNGKGGSKTRRATQSDIDKFTGYRARSD
jgi:hypothetical protein